MSKDIETQNYEFCQQAILLKETIERSFLSLGERLLRIRNENLFLPAWGSFVEYLDELGLSEAKASKLIGIFEKYVIMGGIDPNTLITPQGWSGLAEFLPYVKTKEDAARFAQLGTSLTRSDIRKETHELRTGKQMSDCEHKNTYTVVICKDCGDRVRKYTEHES